MHGYNKYNKTQIHRRGDVVTGNSRNRLDLQAWCRVPVGLVASIPNRITADDSDFA